MYFSFDYSGQLLLKLFVEGFVGAQMGYVIAQIVEDALLEAV